MSSLSFGAKKRGQGKGGRNSCKLFSLVNEKEVDKGKHVPELDAFLDLALPNTVVETDAPNSDVPLTSGREASSAASL